MPGISGTPQHHPQPWARRHPHTVAAPGVPRTALQGTHLPPAHCGSPSPSMGHHQPWLSLAPSLPELTWTQFTGLKQWNKSHNFCFKRSDPSDFTKVIFLLISTEVASEDELQDNTHLKYKWTAASDQIGSEKRLKGKWWRGKNISASSSFSFQSVCEAMKRVFLWLMQFSDYSLERRKDPFTAVSTIPTLLLKKIAADLTCQASHIWPWKQRISHAGQ